MVYMYPRESLHVNPLLTFDNLKHNWQSNCGWKLRTDISKQFLRYLRVLESTMYQDDTWPKKYINPIIANNNLYWEFDPGSGWTLAACLRHASHGGRKATGRWVSTTVVIYLEVLNNTAKAVLIQDGQGGSYDIPL